MKAPEALVVLLRDRLTKNPAWWAARYEEAIDRIEDHTDDSENPYWEGPDGDSAIPGGGIIDMSGAELHPEQVERWAFDLLVLADLARSGETEDR